jgi:hypothetical protein
MSSTPPRRATLLDALTDEPTSTSDLYERLGYRQLLRAGLISYHEFRAALEALAKEGLARAEEGDDGSTLWVRAEPGEPA